jgi:hypothetical protein
VSFVINLLHENIEKRKRLFLRAKSRRFAGKKQAFYAQKACFL